MMDAAATALIDSAKALLRASGYCVENLWHVDDIHFICEQRNWPQLNHEEAGAVFDIFSEMFDGGQGLNWERLERATESYLSQQGRIREMMEREDVCGEAQRINQEDAVA